jgi:hypothetical protein
MAFVPENDLERAMVQGATNPAAWAAFYHLLLNVELFALGLVEDTEGANKKIRLAQIEFKNRIYHPIFSAPSRMAQYVKEHPKYFGMKGRELFASARGAYFLLNPGSDYAKELLPEEIAELLASEDPAKAPEPGTVLISKPVVFPLALADALAKLFATRPGVEAAYLAQMSYAGKNEPPHPIVGVKLEGEWEPLAQEIQRVVAPLPQGTRVAALQIGADDVRKVLGEMLMRYEPFYVRTAKLH